MFQFLAAKQPGDEFQRAGLEAVAKSPHKPYTGIVTEGDRRYFKAIFADRAVSTACVMCQQRSSPQREAGPLALPADGRNYYFFSSSLGQSVKSYDGTGKSLVGFDRRQWMMFQTSRGIRGSVSRRRSRAEVALGNVSQCLSFPCFKPRSISPSGGRRMTKQIVSALIRVVFSKNSRIPARRANSISHVGIVSTIGGGMVLAQSMGLHKPSRPSTASVNSGSVILIALIRLGGRRAVHFYVSPTTGIERRYNLEVHRSGAPEPLLIDRADQGPTTDERRTSETEARETVA